MSTGSVRGAAFLRDAESRSRAERAAIEVDVSRVSDKLHLRQPRRTLPFGTAIRAELAATAVGGALLVAGLVGVRRLGPAGPVSGGAAAVELRELLMSQRKGVR